MGCLMRILFLSYWYPYPPDNGSRIRIYNLIQHLARRHEITLLAFTDGDFNPESAKPLQALCPVIRTTPRIPFQPGRIKAIAGLASSRPRSLVDTYSATMDVFVREELASGTYDVVIASQLQMAAYVEGISGIPKIFEEVEVGGLQAAVQNAAGWRQYKHRLTWAKSSRFLRRLLDGFDACTVVSADEKEALVEIGVPARQIAVLPNAIDVQAYMTRATPIVDQLVYNGALTYSANYDAMRYFVGDIFPLIRAERPQAQVKITGRTTNVPIEELPQLEGVTFTGYLPDVRPTVAESWASVVPLRQGGGTRLKILEAMALGTPVISTGKGAEGLEVKHGEQILIADNPADFAECALAVMVDPALRNRLAANARDLVWSKYDARVVGQSFEDLVCEIVERRRVRQVV